MNAFFLHSILLTVFAFSVNGWSWQCNSETRYCTTILTEKAPTVTYPTIELCKLICGDQTLNIWPYPTGTVLAEKSITLIKSLKFEMDGSETTQKFLQDVIEYFHKNINMVINSLCQDSYEMTVILHASSANSSLTMDTDESYSFKMNTAEDRVITEITGNTVFGVRHGIETLLQLLVPFEENNNRCIATLNSVQIDDSPVYRHRGLLLDSARNYLSVNVIKKNLDAMAASKMNVLHWHITDSQSFPLEIPSLPNMTKYGAYSEKSVYTPRDIRYLVEYAKTRGIRILLEIDGPSHAGSGWEWAEEAGLGKLAVCINRQPWRSFCIQPPCGQLNPANSNLYKVLRRIYADIEQMVPSNGVFHMGGDEVYIPCWNATKEIIDYIKNKPRTEKTFLDLWGEFQSKSLAAYDAAVENKKNNIVVWTSHLTEPDVIVKYLPKERYIIQTWVPNDQKDLITSLLNLGYRVIISTKDKWYLDHGFWGSTSYYNWKAVYNNKMYDTYHESILGGEVCMWGELVDDSNVESRVWPRAAAAAERLWSNPQSTAQAAEGRFLSQRGRLNQRGLKTEAILPQWCVQNEGECAGYLGL